MQPTARVPTTALRLMPDVGQRAQGGWDYGHDPVGVI